jgi:Contractile injection system tube protein
MSQLQKARLFSIDGNQFDFEFMFNPTSLQFKEAVKVKDAEGARTAQGQPKVSFEYPKARTLSLKKLMFDTYEDGANVMDKYVNKIRKSVEFAGFSVGQEASAAPLIRPPIYMFVWGKQNYIRCFVEQLDYNLTLFLPDGTPVRAEVNLSLKEVDDSFSNPSMRTYDAQKFGDRDTRTQPIRAIAARDRNLEEKSGGKT